MDLTHSHPQRRQSRHWTPARPLAGIPAPQRVEQCTFSACRGPPLRVHAQRPTAHPPARSPARSPARPLARSPNRPTARPPVRPPARHVTSRPSCARRTPYLQAMSAHHTRTTHAHTHTHTPTGTQNARPRRPAIEINRPLTVRAVRSLTHKTAAAAACYRLTGVLRSSALAFLPSRLRRPAHGLPLAPSPPRPLARSAARPSVRLPSFLSSV